MRSNATLAESDFAVWGTTVYRGVRQFNGKDGLFIHISWVSRHQPTLVFGLTMYQPFAQGYGRPVLYTD